MLSLSSIIVMNIKTLRKEISKKQVAIGYYGIYTWIKQQTYLWISLIVKIPNSLNKDSQRCFQLTWDIIRTAFFWRIYNLTKLYLKVPPHTILQFC